MRLTLLLLALLLMAGCVPAKGSIADRLMDADRYVALRDSLASNPSHHEWNSLDYLEAAGVRYQVQVLGDSGRVTATIHPNFVRYRVEVKR